MTNQELLRIGFEPMPHFTVTGSYMYELGRNRYLSVGCVGTPNEMMWIGVTDIEDSKRVTDLICLHNYDYDGELSEEKIEDIIKAIN